MQKCKVFLIINLRSFVSLFTLYSLGACPADWTNVALRNRKYEHTCTNTQNTNQHDSGHQAKLPQQFQNKTVHFKWYPVD